MHEFRSMFLLQNLNGEVEDDLEATTFWNAKMKFKIKGHRGKFIITNVITKTHIEVEL